MTVKKIQTPGLIAPGKRPEVEDYRQKYRKTLAEWTKFIEGRDDIDPDIIPTEVLSAWHRCRNMGMDPMIMPHIKILKGPSLEALLRKNHDFIEVSRPFLKNIHQFLKGTGFHAILFDKDGYLLEILGDHDMADMISNAGGVVGAQWNEPTAGQSVVGSILLEKKPMQFFGSQHFFRDYHGETGSGAPIFSPEGELLGGISLSARNYRANPHTLGMAVAAAHAVENALRTRRAFADRQRAYDFQQSVIASIMEAMIAVDNTGLITLANEPARQLFSLSSRGMAGEFLTSVLKGKNRPLLRLIETHERITDKEVSIFSNGAWSDYVVTLTPILSAEKMGIGKIIVFNEIKRAKTMLTTMLGARAVYHFDDICGKNSRFLITMEQARMVSKNDSNVLLLGRSGTGKDIFAQSIHNASHRRNGPYVAINCGAIPRDLLASELFGHEEGAFTGARRGGHQGKFELADGGTIFLDEIAELPLELQSVLLRVIEDKLVTRIGGKQTRKIDVRVITATNKNLGEEIARGKFREDLYYRINVFNITLLPLNERQDDIPELTRWFIKKLEKKLGKRISHVDPNIFEVFLNYPWPGNVRELQNAVERMMNFAISDQLTEDLIPQEIVRTLPVQQQTDVLESPLEKEKQMIVKMMGLGFKKMEIAERLNMSRTTLYRKIKKHGLG